MKGLLPEHFSPQVRHDHANDTIADRQPPRLHSGPVTACERYFRAIAARDIDAVLAAMTPEYGRQLRELRRQAGFAAFFALWCESQGMLVSVFSSALDGDAATALLDTGTAVLRATLRRLDGDWLIDGEQVERRLKRGDIPRR